MAEHHDGPMREAARWIHECIVEAETKLPPDEDGCCDLAGLLRLLLNDNSITSVGIPGLLTLWNAWAQIYDRDAVCFYKDTADRTSEALSSLESQTMLLYLDHDERIKRLEAALLAKDTPWGEPFPERFSYH